MHSVLYIAGVTIVNLWACAGKPCYCCWFRITNWSVLDNVFQLEQPKNLDLEHQTPSPRVGWVGSEHDTRWLHGTSQSAIFYVALVIT